MKTERELSVDGTTYRLHWTRRRYGRGMFYTWIVAETPEGMRLDLGDPWPVVSPKRREVEEAIRQTVKRSAMVGVDEGSHDAAGSKEIADL